MLQDVCQTALIVKGHSHTKKAACKAFMKLIELFKDHDLKLVKTVNKFVKAFLFRTHNIKGEPYNLNWIMYRM